MAWLHGPRPVAELEPSNVLVLTSSRTVVLAPGHEARRLGCPKCGDAVGGEPVRLVTAVSGFVCQGCGNHTMAASWLAHDTCLPLDDTDIARRFMESLTPVPE